MANTLSSLPPHILAAYLRDPRAMSALKMQEEGTDTSPVQHPLQGLARMVKGGLGGYQAGSLQQEYDKQGQQYSSALANALKAMQTGGIDAGIAAASADPMLASDFGKDLALSKAKSDYEVNKLMAIELMKQKTNPMNKIIYGDAPSFSPPQAPTGTPQLPPQMGNQEIPMPPMPANAFEGKFDPSKAMGSYVQPDGQPTPAFLPPVQPQPQQTQPQIDGMYNAAVSKEFGKPREGFAWVRGENGMPQEVKDTTTARKLSPTEQKELFDKMDLVNAGNGAIGALDYANKVLGEGNSFTGFGAETLAQANRIPVIGGFIDDKGAKDTTLIKNAVTEQALNQLKAIFGGMPTEGERQVLLQLQALPSYTREEQTAILKRAREAAQNRLQYNQSLVQGIQTGDYRNAGFGQQPQQPTGRVNVMSPDGKAYTIDASELQDALANGWRQQ